MLKYLLKMNRKYDEMKNKNKKFYLFFIPICILFLLMYLPFYTNLPLGLTVVSGLCLSFLGIQRIIYFII
jgi:hypothetical protein